MNDENEILSIELPDSEPIPEILIINSKSDNEATMNELFEEENINEEVVGDDNNDFYEEYSYFSSLPDSTPISENQFLDMKLDYSKQNSLKQTPNLKRKSNCCLLI